MKIRTVVLCLAASAFLTVAAQHTPPTGGSAPSPDKVQKLEELGTKAKIMIAKKKTKKNESIANDADSLIDAIINELCSQMSADEKLQEEYEQHLAEMRSADSTTIARLDSIIESMKEELGTQQEKLNGYAESEQKKVFEDYEDRINNCEQEFLCLIREFINIPADHRTSTLVRCVKKARDLMGDRLDQDLKSKLDGILKEDETVS